MIVDLPKKEDFEVVAKEHLTEAFLILFRIYENYYDIYSGKSLTEYPIKNIWEFQKPALRTALVLLYQGLESILKSKIAEVSPLLLIDQKRNDWPTSPDSKTVPFDTLYTFSGESLLKTYLAIIPEDKSFLILFEDLRKKRNSGVHGKDLVNIDPKYVLTAILTTITKWYGPDEWFKLLKENICNHPLFGSFDSNYESTQSYKYLQFTLDLLGRKTLSKHISTNIKGRPYFCPDCTFYMETAMDKLEKKWAFILADSKLHCINCNNSFEIERRECDFPPCPGNVLYEGIDDGHYLCCTCQKTMFY